MSRPRLHTGFDEAAFEALLAYLDNDRERAGEKYETLRYRLIQLLAWRGSWRPEELADESLSRAGRALHSGGVVQSLEAYCGGIARLLVLEDARKLREVPLEERHSSFSVASVTAPDDRRSLAFDDCLAQVAPPNRKLIMEYYGGDGGDKIRNRRRLALDLGIPLNALRIRAYRIRAAIESCIEEKMRAGEDR